MVEVGRCGGAAIQDAEQREQRHREQCGRRDRDGFGDPPTSHQQGDGGHARDFRMLRVQVAEQQQQERGCWHEPASEPLTPSGCCCHEGILGGGWGIGQSQRGVGFQA